jgi:hypothetical protein
MSKAKNLKLRAKSSSLKALEFSINAFYWSEKYTIDPDTLKIKNPVFEGQDSFNPGTVVLNSGVYYFFTNEIK